MSSSPTLPNPTDRACQRDEDAQYYREVLHKLIAMGTDLAEAIHRQAAPKPSAEQPAAPTPGAAAPQPPQPDLTLAFDRIARTIRRTIALARKLSEPDREAPGPKPRSQDRCAEGCDECRPSARQRRTDLAETDALHAEPCERPEAPDFDADEDLGDDLDDDLDDQSLTDLIASLRHDTGLATLTDAQLRQHRTPQSAHEGVPGEKRGLCARAAGPTAAAKAADRPADRAAGRTADPRVPAPPLPTRTSTGPPAP